MFIICKKPKVQLTTDSFMPCLLIVKRNVYFHVANSCCVQFQVEQFVMATQAECRCAEKYCERLKIYKISEGLYRIGDRNVFIRVLDLAAIFREDILSY